MKSHPRLTRTSLSAALALLIPFSAATATTFAPPDAPPEGAVVSVPGEHRKSAYASGNDADAAASAPEERGSERARVARPSYSQAATASAAPAVAESESPVARFERSLSYQSGRITLSNNLVTLDLGDKYRFLSPEDSRKVIVELWGNPPDSANGVLGMIVPAQGHFDDADFWGAVIKYTEEGHVKDDDAKDIDYTKLLEEMKQASVEENKQRRAGGYEGMDLIGWAVAPRYDAGHHVLHWAKNYKTDKGAKVMNYDVRVLGRKGILSLLVVADPEQLASLQGAIDDLPLVAQYTSGNRYADFDKSSDKMAEYGLAALVAGGAAAATVKAGKLAFLAVLLKKGWVLLVAGVVALRKKLFGRG